MSAAAGQRDRGRRTAAPGVGESAHGEAHGSGGAAGQHATRTATRRCSTRAACSRCSSGTSPGTRRRWSSRSAACRRELFAAGLRADHEQLRPRADHGVRLRRRLDPAHRRRAVHPHRGDPADAARQHRPSRGRDPGPARARLDPGLHRHPDPVQPAPRLHARCRTRTRTRTSTTFIAGESADKGYWGNMRAYTVSLLKAWWGDAATADERLLLRLPAAADRQTTAPTRRCWSSSTGAAAATSCRREPGRRLGQRAGCSGWRWPTWTGWWCATSR